MIRRWLLARALARRFGRRRDGAALLEFSFISLPFFMLLFGVIEVGMAFFASAWLDLSVENAARTIRTGEAQNQKFDLDDFREELCARRDANILFDCNAMRISSRSYASFGELAGVAFGVDEDEQSDDWGVAAEVVVLQVEYDWPLFAAGLLPQLDADGDGERTLFSVLIFRNEFFQ